MCYQYLKEHNNVADVDSSLTEEERASAVAYKAWLEEWVYFLMIWDKWIDNWYDCRETFFARAVPFYPARVVIFNFVVYRNISSMLHAKGITRHSKPEIVSFIAEAAKAMSVLVGEKGMFNGKPCAVNAFMMGILIAIYDWPQLNKAWAPEIAKYPNLRRWTENMISTYFPERKLRC